MASWDGLRQQLAADIMSVRVVSGCAEEPATEAKLPCVENAERSVIARLDPLALPRYEQFAFERRKVFRALAAGAITTQEGEARILASATAWRIAWDRMLSNLAGGEPFWYPQGLP